LGDSWLSKVPFLEKYPRMYINSTTMKAKLGEVGKWNEKSWEWKLQWRKDWFEWEKVQISNLMYELGEYTLGKGKEDEWEWKDYNTPSGCY